MQVKIKKLNKDAVIPKSSNAGDAGLDLTAVSMAYNNESFTIEYGTGIAIEIPEGHAGFIFPRSSIYKKNLSLSNAVGVIDSGYRGEIKAQFSVIPDSFATFNGAKEGDRLFFTQQVKNPYKVGDRIAQLIIMPYPKIELLESDELSDTDRGIGGFGSTGE